MCPFSQIFEVTAVGIASFEDSPSARLVREASVLFTLALGAALVLWAYDVSPELQVGVLVGFLFLVFQVFLAAFCIYQRMNDTSGAKGLIKNELILDCIILHGCREWLLLSALRFIFSIVFCIFAFQLGGFVRGSHMFVLMVLFQLLSNCNYFGTVGRHEAHMITKKTRIQIFKVMAIAGVMFLLICLVASSRSFALSDHFMIPFASAPKDPTTDVPIPSVLTDAQRYENFLANITDGGPEPRSEHQFPQSVCAQSPVGLSVVDFAFMSSLVYYPATEAGVRAPAADLTVKPSDVIMSAQADVFFNQQHGQKRLNNIVDLSRRDVKVYAFEFSEVQDDVTVIAVRGTSNSADALFDVYILFDAVIIDRLFPFTGITTDLAKAFFVKVHNWVLRKFDTNDKASCSRFADDPDRYHQCYLDQANSTQVQGSNSYFETVNDVVNDYFWKKPERFRKDKVAFTGHSLGGMLSTLAAAELRNIKF